MNIQIEWKITQYPTFKIFLRRSPESDPFLTVHDCRIVDGKNGPFVSYPAKKDANGKYWNYLQGGEAFNAHILQLAQAGQQAAPPPRPPPAPLPKPAQGSGFDDMQDDVPF